ncbi:MAG TPA: hypothetical protein VFF05_09240, partial [Rudaea sp.]|nr:hypothetical protein [Rudaea sp.]
MRACLARQAPANEEELKRMLRQLRQQVMLRVMLRDLSGRAPLTEVVGSMSDLAELGLDYALGYLSLWLRAQHGTPSANGRAQELIVVGMGKLGGRELNVSSDIDLIFVYPEEGETVGSAGQSGAGAALRLLSNHEYFTRLGRKLINVLADITEDGQVFRVDMRLRPNGDSGPLACSLDALENYFIAEGREWERYAWIKARVVATSGDPSALATSSNASVAASGDAGIPAARSKGAGDENTSAQQLGAVARPFVFRKYLDFGAFAAMRSLHAQIRAEVARRDRAGHIKLGPGGIREIEFTAQVFQLIRGGSDARLRIRPTRSVLQRLAENAQMSLQDVAALDAAYVFLRNLEHRLQYLDDRQTQELPETPEDREIIACGMGYADYAAFITELDRHRKLVSRQFELIFGAQPLLQPGPPMTEQA